MAAARPLLVVLTGPTGTGKSELALQLADYLTQRRPLEIVSVDSAQVYRGMDIGTAKPSRAVRARVPHHLIDIRNPCESYSAGDFVRDARIAIDAIHGRGRVPLLVGGTMLYLRALHDGLATLPAASSPMRQTIDAEAVRCGWPAMHAELERVDPEAAAHIASHDAQRIQRALEVYRLTGIPISAWQRRTHGARDEFQWLRYALLPDSRTELRQRLSLRFQDMLQAGLVEEVRALQARGDLSERHPAMRAVGYRQIWRFCRGDCSLEEASEQAVVATAQLSKRQMTWLRREQGMITLTAQSHGQAIRVGAEIESRCAHDRPSAR
ncbi:MAG TPA: tRNA (adenosine(37)-N6)-dimethylallyltransferase MiaA [Steroidobacteraceae bacterium]|jgi:tRNA dimethylallyltransferase|nr:tRNA (adenosine(37)-N6)-dimethylallyltransferase MiaA [Steroidobacteraceae bacterium]